MKSNADVYVAADNVITSLGYSTRENIENLRNGVTGIRYCDNPEISNEPFFVSLINNNILSEKAKLNNLSDKYTRAEQLVILSINETLKQTEIDIKNKKTAIIISTTKGNIDLLEASKKAQFPQSRLYLWELGNVIGNHFKNPNPVYVVSNACVSGVLAIITAMKMIRAGRFENVVVTGVDILSKFVIAGFQSFKSISTGPCKPFDSARDGLSLGEGCGTIVLTSDKSMITSNENIKVISGATSNDANHLSAPSRTAEGLFNSIQKALNDKKAKEIKNIDYISAHGTATPYNDEMEAKGISRCGLSEVPVNSFKGYIGHTLGAAGIIESIYAITSLKENELYQSIGYNSIGVPDKINIIDKYKKIEIGNCLKLASGFGGSNAVILFAKS